jgi:hypothetical protein
MSHCQKLREDNCGSGVKRSPPADLEFTGRGFDPARDELHSSPFRPWLTGKNTASVMGKLNLKFSEKILSEKNWQDFRIQKWRYLRTCF